MVLRLFMEDFVQIKAIRLAYLRKEAKGALLSLQEVDGERSFSVMIGMEEATSIATYLSRLQLPVALTHDLMHQLMLQCHASVQKVVIHAIEKGVFRSSLQIQHNDESFTLSARISDAVAMALRFDKPIYMNRALFESLVCEGSNPTSISSTITPQTDLSSYSTRQLNALLKDCVQREDYEQAVLLRDELNLRKSNTEN